EIFEAGQPTVLDDEVEISERGGSFVDVGDIERITVEGPDGRPLVHVNVLDPEFSAPLQETVGPPIGELPTPGIFLPLSGVELDAPDSEAMDQRLEVLQACFAVPRVPGTVEDEPVGMLILEDAVLLGGVEPVLVEVLQVGGLKDAHVDVSVDEDILHHP